MESYASLNSGCHVTASVTHDLLLTMVSIITYQFDVFMQSIKVLQFSGTGRKGIRVDILGPDRGGVMFKTHYCVLSSHQNVWWRNIGFLK